MKVAIGYVIMKGGKALRTGGYNRGLTAKVYQRIGIARNVADRYGGEVVEAYIDATSDYSIGPLSNQ